MKDNLAYAEDIIEEKRTQLEKINDEIEELEEKRAELKAANAVSFKMLEAAMPLRAKALELKVGAKEIENHQKKPEEIAAKTKKELREITKKLQTKYLEKECLEEQIEAAQRGLEYIEEKL